MKRVIFVLISFILSSTLLFAKSKESVPAFEGGTVINLKDFRNGFKDNILVTNYSSASSAKFEFYFYANEKESWKKAGEGDLPAFGSELKAYKKPNMKKPRYIAYVTNLSSDFRVVPAVENHDLKLYVFDSCATFAGTNVLFENIADSKEDGIIKLNTASRRANYEDNLRVVDAPNCVIYYVSPTSKLWEVFGVVRGGKLWSNYHDDIDEIEPYWIVQICGARKNYTIETYTKFDDLYLKFVLADSMLSIKSASQTIGETPAVSAEADVDVETSTVVPPAVVDLGEALAEKPDADSSENEHISAEGIYEPAIFAIGLSDDELYGQTSNPESETAASAEVASVDEDLSKEDPKADEPAIATENESVTEEIPVVVASEPSDVVVEEKASLAKTDSDSGYRFGDGDLAEDLLKLKDFYDAGLITEDEYKLKKAQLLGI